MRKANTNLLFPKIFRAMRVRKGLMQKVAALELGIDTAVLCGTEKGTRGPASAEVLTKAGSLYQLTPEESASLQWAAHHDRLITPLVGNGASHEEVELISAALSVWHHLKVDQRHSWLSAVKRMDESARAVASLSIPQLHEETMMN